MNSLLYTIVVILLICWALGFFFTAIGSIIHLLLVIAIIMVLLKIIRRPTAV